MTAELVYAATDPAWPRVRTQISARKGHPVRYGYVITEQDGNSWVSDYRWHTAEAAQRAGEADHEASETAMTADLVCAATESARQDDTLTSRASQGSRDGRNRGALPPAVLDQLAAELDQLAVTTARLNRLARANKTDKS